MKKTLEQRQTEALESIADSLKKLAITEVKKETKSTTSEPIEEHITITDDGKKKTSELLKDIGYKYWSYWNYEDLDKLFPPPQQSTSRKFRAVQEADEEYKNMSYRDLEEKGLIDKCITLRERLIMEKLWFDKNGTHLDIDKLTLCAGSRDPNGNVPNVNWNGDNMNVNWYSSDYRRDDIRARAAIS